MNADFFQSHRKDNVAEYFHPAETDYTGCYLPHVFDTKRASKKVSIIHLLLKSMPQRCQFRNFNNVVLHQLENIPGKIDWFKKILVWCLSGINYQWAGSNRISGKSRQSLCSVINNHNIDWCKVIKGNLNLIFFAVKEYFVWSVQQQPSLRRYLTAAYEWGVYEQEIYFVMNKVRATYQDTSNPKKLEQINNYLLSFSPNQMKCLRKMFSSKPVEIAIKTNLQYTSVPIVSYANLVETERVLLREVAEHIEWFWLCYLCEERNDAKTMSYWMTLNEDLKQLFHNYMHVSNLLKNIKILKLSINYANAQVHATVKKYDVALSRAGCDNIQQVTNNWFCPSCKRFRGFLANAKSRNRSNGVNISAYGHEKMAINMYNGNVYCVASQSAGANAAGNKNACGDVPCIRINMLGRFVSFYDNVVALCTKCASPCVTNVNDDYLNDGMICCGLCSARSKCPNTSFCGYCMHRCTVLREFRMYDDTQTPNKWMKIRLCPKHRKSNWASNSILLKSIYCHTMENEI